MHGAATAAMIAVAMTLSTSVGARVRSRSPWWWQDGFRSTAGVAEPPTTADVNTTGSGTVTLPARGAVLAFAPGRSPNRIVLAGAAKRIQAWRWNGSAMTAAPTWSLTLRADVTGIAWLGGMRVVVGTAQGLTVYGGGAAGWVVLARTGLTGVVGIAPGPLDGIVVATANALQVYAWDGSGLVRLPGAGFTGMQAIRGVAAAPAGKVLAAWTATGVRTFGWDGGGLRETPARDAAVAMPLAGVAFFPDGRGYWVLAGGRVTAYAFRGPSVGPWSAASVAGPPPSAMELATGWGARDVAVLVPTGWVYYSWSAQGLRRDPARSVSDASLGVYAPSALLQSVPLPVGHGVDQVRLETVTALPPGTGVAWWVSTDGCATWDAITPGVNLTVTPGTLLCYRARLTSSSPTQTPIIDRVDLFEIATVLHEERRRAVLVR